MMEKWFLIVQGTRHVKGDLKACFWVFILHCNKNRCISDLERLIASITNYGEEFPWEFDMVYKLLRNLLVIMFNFICTKSNIFIWLLYSPVEKLTCILMLLRRTLFVLRFVIPQIDDAHNNLYKLL